MANVLIAGASSGIGLSLSKQLIEKGEQVYATYNKTSSTLNGFAKFHQLNVLDESIDFSFLPDTLDGLVYCPGTINLKPFARIRPEDFITDYQLQLVGAVKVIHACLPKLKNAASPSIVLFSTVAAQTGFTFHSLVASSKGAIEGLTKALAAELAPKVRVNCIAPSITDNASCGSVVIYRREKRSECAAPCIKKDRQT